MIVIELQAVLGSVGNQPNFFKNDNQLSFQLDYQIWINLFFLLKNVWMFSLLTQWYHFIKIKYISKYSIIT